MIPLKRVRTEAAVHPNFRDEKRVALNLSLLQKKITGQLDGATSDLWNSAIWKEAKAQLLEESSGKCAYCESPTTVVSFGDVEHFRPKSTYWWLAYCYENYLPACIMCNQKFKRDFFATDPKGKTWTGPVIKTSMTEAQLLALARKMTVDPVTEKKGMSMKKFLDTLKKERPLIINPYFQDPADYFAYKPILANKEVILVPRKPAHEAIVAACDKLYGVNRQELRDERYRHYVNYITYKYTMLVSRLPAKLRKAIGKRLVEMQDGSLRYTGMIRYFETQKLEDLPWDFS